MTNYALFELEDFLVDEYFIRWVKAPLPEHHAFWNAFLSKYPDRKAIILHAREIVFSLEVKAIYPQEGKFLEIWENISNAEEKVELIVNFPEVTTFTEKKIKEGRLKTALAVVGGIIAVAFFLYLFTDPFTTKIITVYGESRTVLLPDSTKVTVNANSLLRYRNWSFLHQREVWLDGEAYFFVVHKADSQNFLVHTNELDVKVVGTRFNVCTRRGVSQVVLEEGKVELECKQKNTTTKVSMRPNDFIAFSDHEQIVQRKNVNPDRYTSWRNNRLTFEGETLEEIARLLEDNYGYTVVIADDYLRAQKFTGSAPADDPVELLQKLSKAFDLRIEQQQGNHIVLRSS